MFEYREGGLLVIERQALTFLLIGITAFRQQMIIEPTTLFKGFVELGKLLFIRIEAILKNFTHASSIQLNWNV